MARAEHERGPSRLSEKRDAAWWSNVNETPGCWEWAGKPSADGYGSFWNGKREVPAHRYGYEMLRGTVPAEYDMDHICRNTMCVKPTHLEPVLPIENVRRANTHCRNGHLLTPENTYVYPKSGARLCTTCNPKNQPSAYRLPRVTPWHAQAAQMYEAGATQAQIAEALGKDGSVVCRALQKMEIPARPAEVPIPRPLFESLVEAGMRKSGLKRIFGCSDQVVKNRATEWTPDAAFPPGAPTKEYLAWEDEMVETYRIEP